MNNSSDPDHCDRWWIAGIEQASILAILIVAIARIVRACFFAGIAGVVHSDPNDRNAYVESRLIRQYLNYLPFKPLNETEDALINHGMFLKELIPMHYFIQLEGT